MWGKRNKIRGYEQCQTGDAPEEFEEEQKSIES